jgi:hypothetical protein
MNYYHVLVLEDPGDTDFVLVFPCLAEDKDHACDQAIDMYYGAAVVSVTKVAEADYLGSERLEAME